MKKSNIIAIIVCTALIIGLLVGFKYWNEYRVSRSTAAAQAISSLTITFDGENGEAPRTTYEYGDGIVKTEDLVKSHGGKLTVDVEEIDCNKVGVTEVTYLMTTTDIYGRDFSNSETIKFEVIDTASPEIALDANIVDVVWGARFDYNSNVVSVSDPVDGDLEKGEDGEEPSPGKYVFDGNVNTLVSGEYTVKIIATDINGNVSEADYMIVVGEQPMVQEEDESEEESPTGEGREFNGKPFQIRINRVYNTLTIYTPGEDGVYSVPFTVMSCACSDITPLGTFATQNTWRWVGIYGDSYAQYATQFYGNYLLQSVPYYSESPDDLIWEDYNKLGSTTYTQGSIWLTAADAKWIYDNVGSGTEVVIYDDATDPGPLGQPGTLHIDSYNEKRGWDPTDPDPRNPWSR